MLHPFARLLLIISDMLAFVLAFMVSFMLARYVSEEIFGVPYAMWSGGGGPSRELAFSVFAVTAMLFFYNRGHYTSRIPWWNQVRYILAVCAGMLCVDGFIHFALKYPFSRLWIVFSWGCAFPLLLAARMMARKIALWAKCWHVPTLVIGDKENVLDTLYALHSESFTGYKVEQAVLYEGYDTFDAAALPESHKHITLYDSRKTGEAPWEQFPEAFIVVAPDNLRRFPLEQVVQALQRSGRHYVIVPPFEGVPLYEARPQYFFGYDVMFLWPRARIHSPFGKVVKRLVDIIGSGTGLLLLLPLLIVLALLIRKDGGQAIFKQPRVGKEGKLFMVWKFRTMAVDAEERLKEMLQQDAAAKKEWETYMKLKHDPRITLLGRFLRKTSLDELPQLVNVLKGEMSLVGPRPMLEDQIGYYGEAFHAYCSVKPGITGLWQISGRNNTTFQHRAHLDDWYVRNWSLWCDIVILFKTVKIVLFPKGAY